jgi:hypothetical protein
MSPRLQDQIAKSKEQALAAFVSKKAEIDAMLTRLQALSDDHFNYSPDEVDLGHVGTLGHYAELLKRVTGTSSRPSFRAASSRPWPARMPAFSSIRIGLVQPNSTIDAAI